MLEKLDRFHHWTLKPINRDGRRAGYECCIWSGGRRVSAQAKSVHFAIDRAIRKWQDATRPKLKVVG